MGIEFSVVIAPHGLAPLALGCHFRQLPTLRRKTLTQASMADVSQSGVASLP